MLTVLSVVDADILQPEAGEPRLAPHRDDESVEGNAHLGPAMLGNQGARLDPHGLVSGQHG